MAKATKKPFCIVIAGPNGAGKTTFAREFLPKDASVIHFVNARNKGKEPQRIHRSYTVAQRPEGLLSKFLFAKLFSHVPFTPSQAFSATTLPSFQI